MYYKAIIEDVVDELYIRVKINDCYLWCFSNIGYDGYIGDEVSCGLELFGDLSFSEVTGKKDISLIDGISYSISGLLNINNGVLESLINFDIDEFFLSEFSYLDGRMVCCNVDRINIEFY